MAHDPGLDHHIVHRDYHASCVRVVSKDDVATVSSEMRRLFPHETVHVTPIGCCHRCVYTDHAPASLVAERIAEHWIAINADGGKEPEPKTAHEIWHASEEPEPGFFGRDRDNQ